MRELCQAEHHAGDRLVDRHDVCEIRLEARRVHNQSRERTHTLSRWCMVCVRARFDQVDAGQASLMLDER
jgi:hypothetical protein